MKQPEFFNNISFFSKDDLADFGKFIDSPFFNALHSVVIVYAIIKNNIKLIHDKNFKDLKSIILKESKFSDIHLRKILSKLNELYIEYIKIKALRSDKYSIEYISAVYLLQTCNYGLLNKRISLLENFVSDAANIHHELFIKLFDLDTLKYAVSTSSENNINPLSKNEEQNKYILESGKNLFVYFIARETINFLNYVIQCNGVDEVKYSVDLENHFAVMSTPEFKSYNNIQKTTLTLFYRIFRLFNNPSNDSHYKSYKLYFNKIKHLYNHEFCKVQNGILLSFCSLRQRIKDKDRFYYLEAFNLLLEYINNRYYISESVKYLDTIIYRNYIVSCVNNGNKTLLAEFRDKHTDKLNPDDKYIMSKFCSAHLHYMNKNYEQSIIDASILSDMKVYLKFDLFLLLIRSYYELNNFEAIRNTLHNYLYYLDSGTYFTKFDKERYKQFYKLMNKFVTVYFNYNKNGKVEEFEYLLKQTESVKTFVMKNWIIEKLTAIIKHHYSGGKRGSIKR